jgi:hypothetical protein
VKKAELAFPIADTCVENVSEPEMIEVEQENSDENLDSVSDFDFDE